MIGRLKGIVEEVHNDHVIVDVNGVGYMVYASARTRGQCTKGEAVRLFIETHVREDHIHLFGFVDQVEQDWFNLLTTVQGVGNKVAIAILSVASVNDLSLAIAAQDKAVFTQADGVGPKLGARIVSELKDKAGKMSLGGTNISGDINIAQASAPQGIDQDALSALLNLGYARSEAFTAIGRVKQNANDDLGVLIRLALQELSA